MCNDYFLPSGLMKALPHRRDKKKEHIIHSWYGALLDHWPQAYCDNQTTALVAGWLPGGLWDPVYTYKTGKLLEASCRKWSISCRKQTTANYIQSVQRRYYASIRCEAVKDQYEHLITNYPSLFLQCAPKIIDRFFPGSFLRNSRALCQAW